jgi:hypothetical protein
MNLDPLAYIQLFLSVLVFAQDLHTLVAEPQGSSRYNAWKCRLKLSRLIWMERGAWKLRVTGKDYSTFSLPLSHLVWRV